MNQPTEVQAISEMGLKENVEENNRILAVLPIIYQAKHHSGRSKWLNPTQT